MGCNCGKRQDETLVGTTLRHSPSFASSSSGIYDTMSAPGCIEPYHGAFARSNVYVYVVDINGDDEQFFLRGQRNEASQIARRGRRSLDTVHPANLCHDLMVQLFGA